MDLFKKYNNNEATSIDFYDNQISRQNHRLRKKDKKMLHKLSRTRIKREDIVILDEYIMEEQK